MLTRAEIDQRLKALPPFEGGTPDEWAEMGMSAERCSCGRWLQIVRPDKYQCACELPEVRAQDREREALETALAAMDERDAALAEGRLLREALERECIRCIHHCELPELDQLRCASRWQSACTTYAALDAPLAAAEAERVKELETDKHVSDAMVAGVQKACNNLAPQNLVLSDGALDLDEGSQQ